MVVLTGWNYKESGCLGLKMWLLAVLTGGRINRFFYETMNGSFSGPIKCGRNNKVAVLTKWP